MIRSEKLILISKFIGHKKPMNYDSDWNHLIPVLRELTSILPNHKESPMKEMFEGLNSFDIEKTFNYCVLSIIEFQKQTGN